MISIKGPEEQDIEWIKCPYNLKPIKMDGEYPIRLNIGAYVKFIGLEEIYYITKERIELAKWNHENKS